MDAAITATRRRQSARIAGQVGTLTTAASRYDNSDGTGATGITAVSV
jgi:hypothetical protein